MVEENITGTTKSYQQQTLWNLYRSGIPTETIAFQLDMSLEEVDMLIEKTRNEQEQLSAKLKSSGLYAASSMDLFYLDAVVNIDLAIKRAQNSMWEALKSESTFDFSMEETHKILDKFANSKVSLVILHIDLVDSTRLSMTLPIERLNDNSSIYPRSISND